MAADNVTGISCFTEVVSILDSGYSAYYFINDYYISNETDYLSLVWASVKAV